MIAVVQPHRYTRLEALMEDFQKAFNDADIVFVAPVYPAGEEPIEGVDSAALVEGLRAGGHRMVQAVADAKDLARALRDVAAEGDMVICMGAGDITKWAASLADKIRSARTPNERLATMPRVRGKLTPDAPLAPLVWFKSGGNAEWLFEPKDEQDLTDFLRDLDPDVPVMALGLGSNMIVRDGGVPGVVVRLGKPFAKIEPVDSVTLRCGGGASGILGLVERARLRHRGPRIPARDPRHRRRLRPDERRRLRPRGRGRAGVCQGRVAFWRGRGMAARPAGLHLSPQRRAARRGGRRGGATRRSR